MEQKTHWLQSPNKNYLGHWDLPENQDLVLTIESAKWEEVKNPIINKSEAKRVVRFKEKGIKPFICNQGNAQSIIKSTGVKYMEDSNGQQIRLYIGAHFDRINKENIDCIRIRSEKTIPKPELKKDTEAYYNCVKALNNGYKIDDLKVKYTLTKEIEEALKFDPSKDEAV